MGTSFTGEVSSDRLTSCPGVVRATCQPNVTEIRDWLRPYEPYGSKRQTFFTLQSEARNTSLVFTTPKKSDILYPSRKDLATFMRVRFSTSVCMCRLMYALVFF